MRLIIISVLLNIICFNISSQSLISDTNIIENLFLVTKNDGGEYIGEIISDDGREILMVTKSIGKLFINKSDIKSITKVNEKISERKNGEFRSSGPFTTRYYFTNNALPIKKNENYALIHVYGPEVHFSVANKTSIGIMASWIASPVAMVIKQQVFSKNKVHLSIGSILGSSGYINQGQTFGGLHWGTLTFGDRISNISFSAGLAHINWPSNNTNFMSGIREIGERYSYDYYDSDHEYFNQEMQDDYNALYAFEDSLNISWNWGWNGNNNNSRYLYKNKQMATVIGVSGIAPVGKKASFIFDSMVFITNNQQMSYKKDSIYIEYEGGNPNGNSSFTAKYGRGYINDKTSRNITFILMPGMRFNKSYDKGFQVALAGFINYDEVDGLVSAPVPMISWLRKF